MDEWLELDLRYVKNHIFRGLFLLPEHRWRVVGTTYEGTQVYEEQDYGFVDLWSADPPQFMTGNSRLRLQETLDELKARWLASGKFLYRGHGAHWYQYRFTFVQER